MKRFLKSPGAAPSGSDTGVSFTHLLFCVLVVAVSDGPGAEGRHQPHLRDATDQDQAARHLLQRLPNPVQLRGTEPVRQTSGSFHFCTYTVHLMRVFYLFFFLWNIVEDYILFSKFWTQRKLLSGPVFRVTIPPLEFSYEFKAE